MYGEINHPEIEDRNQFAIDNPDKKIIQGGGSLISPDLKPFYDDVL